MTTRFKLRAECFQDVVEFINKVPKKVWQIKVEQEDFLPDMVFEFSSEMTLQEIILVLSKIQDGHVMMDTINPIEKYTGERRYGLE